MRDNLHVRALFPGAIDERGNESIEAFGVSAFIILDFEHSVIKTGGGSETLSPILRKE